MRRHPFPRPLRSIGLVATLAMTVVMSLVSMAVSNPAGADSTTLSPVNGQGSTYAASAIAQWVANVESQGQNVNYTPTNSPAGLESYANETTDFAGTEAEFSELDPSSPDPNPPRGFAYTPDVAGATAIMYNVDLNSGNPAAGVAPSDPVTYLHLSRLTVAKIFLGVIDNWDDPAISEDNKGLVLPPEPITVDCRSGQSGTTALFYDFVEQTDPTDYATWAKKNDVDPSVRLLEVDDLFGGYVPHSQCLSGSDLQAQTVASSGGLWSIGYDEFSYAKQYNDNVAWIENASGNWEQPYATNISAALASAVLAPDTSQNLDSVYTSTNPAAYPISAYSYILFQCAPTSARPTCATPYTNSGVANTMAQFMSYIACAGQIQMATIGYAPLPPQLSQFMANAVGYVTGQPPVTLTAQNCNNPTFAGGDGQGSSSPPDPTVNVPSLGPGPGGNPATTATTTPSAGGTVGSTGRSGPASKAAGGPAVVGQSGTSGTTTTTVPDAAGLAGSPNKAVGGGSATWLPPAPVAYVGPVVKYTSSWPLIALLLVLLISVVILSIGRRRSRRVPENESLP